VPGKSIIGGSIMKKLLFLLLLSPLLLLAQSNQKIMLQVLGSGGPEMNDKRASSSYLIWIDGKSRILIDFGSGASLRFEESDANIEELDMILLTHLHIDHTADLPALLKAGFFTNIKKYSLSTVPTGTAPCPIPKHSSADSLKTIKEPGNTWETILAEKQIFNSVPIM